MPCYEEQLIRVEGVTYEYGGGTRMPCYEEQLIRVEGVTYEYGGGTRIPCDCMGLFSPFRMCLNLALNDIIISNSKHFMLTYLYCVSVILT